MVTEKQWPAGLRCPALRNKPLAQWGCEAVNTAFFGMHAVGANIDAPLEAIVLENAK